VGLFKKYRFKLNQVYISYVQLEDAASQARILNNMSNIYEKNRDLDSAIECQKDRFEKLHECCDINGQIKCAAGLGGLFILQGDIRESIMYYEKAVISLRMKIGRDCSQICNTLMHGNFAA